MKLRRQLDQLLKPVSNQYKSVKYINCAKSKHARFTRSKDTLNIGEWGSIYIKQIFQRKITQVFQTPLTTGNHLLFFDWQTEKSDRQKRQNSWQLMSSKYHINNILTKSINIRRNQKYLDAIWNKFQKMITRGHVCVCGDGCLCTGRCSSKNK